MAFSDQRHRTHDVSSQRKYIESQNTRFLLLDLRLRPGAAEIPCSVGSISVHFDPPNEKADMGLLIIPEFKSRRFGREAWEATMSALFGYGVFKIEAGTPQDNMAMRYIMTQARMRIEGRRFNSFLLDGGKRTDVLLYGRTREA
jgi:RimJ/RimL family protein N-acetyltransferase